MAFRDLLVHVDLTDSAMRRAMFALQIAKRHDAHVKALYVSEDSRVFAQESRSAEMGLIPAAEFEKFRKRHARRFEDEIAKRKADLAAAAKELNVDLEWCFVEGSARLVFTQQARCADVCILGQEDPSGDLGASAYSFAEEMLFSTGRPIICLPSSGSFDDIGRHVVVAWNASRFAARAIADALPALEAADRVTVLSINPKRYEAALEAAPIDAIVPHLQRHCRSVNFLSVDLNEGNIALEIMAQADRLQADLVVAGGYGHPRLWEKMLGGVTRDLLTKMTLPLLMSH